MIQYLGRFDHYQYLKSLTHALSLSIIEYKNVRPSLFVQPIFINSIN